MWRDIVAVLVLVALFVAALLSMPGETPTERERFLRSRWERCEQLREIEKKVWRYDGDGDPWCTCARVYRPAWVYILSLHAGVRMEGVYVWRVSPEEWIAIGGVESEHAARAAVEVGP
jgi:hypothetical protein